MSDARIYILRILPLKKDASMLGKYIKSMADGSCNLALRPRNLLIEFHSLTDDFDEI